MKPSLSDYEIHPAAKLFPMMDPAALKELAVNIEENGLIEPIVRHQGKILDGRNRFVACGMAGVQPRFREWAATGSATAWVLSVNLHRRHLTQSQKAALATEALKLFEAEAKERQSRNAVAKNTGTPNVELIPPSEQGKARDKAAAAVGVNPRYVSDAKKIKEEAPEVFEKVKSGEITIPGAKRSIIRPIVPPQLSPSEQKQIEEAEKDSERLWLLKDAWRKASKKEKEQFNKWAGLKYDK